MHIDCRLLELLCYIGWDQFILQIIGSQYLLIYLFCRLLFWVEDRLTLMTDKESLEESEDYLTQLISGFLARALFCFVTLYNFLKVRIRLLTSLYIIKFVALCKIKSQTYLTSKKLHNLMGKPCILIWIFLLFSKKVKII